MPVDQDRYRSLIARAAFNAEYWRGTAQDLSSAQRVVVINGTLRFVPYGSVVGATMRAAADYTYRDNVPALVDATASFSLETLVYPCNGIVIADIKIRTTQGNRFIFQCAGQIFPVFVMIAIRAVNDTTRLARMLVGTTVFSQIIKKDIGGKRLCSFREPP